MVLCLMRVGYCLRGELVYYRQLDVCVRFVFCSSVRFCRGDSVAGGRFRLHVLDDDGFILPGVFHQSAGWLSCVLDKRFVANWL